MALRPINFLKSLFTTGSKPQQQDYYDVLDSYVHKDDVEEINSTVINTALTGYDNALKGVTAGQINTLGDVLQILAGFDTTDDVRAMLDAAGGQSVPWASITSKPAQIQVAWDEQVISLLGVSPGTATSTSLPASTSAISLGTGLANRRVVITDIGFHNIAVVPYQGSTASVIVSRLTSITLGVTPRIALL